MDMTLEVRQCCSKQNLVWDMNCGAQVLFPWGDSSACAERGHLQESTGRLPQLGFLACLSQAGTVAENRG